VVENRFLGGPKGVSGRLPIRSLRSNRRPPSSLGWEGARKHRGRGRLPVRGKRLLMREALVHAGSLSGLTRAFSGKARRHESRRCLTSHDMNSEQEALVRLLMERSTGSPFMFRPDEYRKGSSTREPADLAWVCNGCVVLFYMQRTVKSCAVAIEHNLEQAKGWLRAWRNGRPLTGHNTDQSFSIAHDGYTRVVVVSVVDCDDGMMRYHADKCVELKVARCATITQTALHMLANAGATMHDLVRIIELLRHRGDVAPLGVISAIAQYEHEARAAAMPSLRFPEEKCSHLLNEAAKLSLAMRQPRGATPEHADWTCAAVFNDFSLKEHLQLVFAVASTLYEIGEFADRGQTKQVVRRLQFDRMDVILRAAPLEALSTLFAIEPAIARPTDPSSAGSFDILVGTSRYAAGPNGIIFAPLIAFKGRPDCGPSCSTRSPEDSNPE
jgi:hypothetical protein